MTTSERAYLDAILELPPVTWETDVDSVPQAQGAELSIGKGIYNGVLAVVGIGGGPGSPPDLVGAGVAALSKAIQLLQETGG